MYRTPLSGLYIALLSEKKKDFNGAMEGYTSCLQQSNVYLNTTTLDDKQAIEEEKNRKIIFLKEIRGEVLLRIAILKKEMGQIDASMSMCNSIQSESFNDTIKANTLCLKVRGRRLYYPHLIHFF